MGGVGVKGRVFGVFGTLQNTYIVRNNILLLDTWQQGHINTCKTNPQIPSYSLNGSLKESLYCNSIDT
jgi:hypothetical protein